MRRIVTIALAMLAAVAFTLDANGQCRTTYAQPTYRAQAYVAPTYYQAPPVVFITPFSFQYNAPNDPRLFDQRFSPTPLQQPAQPQLQQNAAPQPLLPAGFAARPEDDLPVAVEAPVAVSVRENLAAVKVETHALGVLRHHCASCHEFPGRQTAAGEDIWLFGANKQFDASIDRKRIVAAVLNNSMPKAAKHDPFKAVSAADKNVLQLWASLGQRTDLASTRPVSSGFGGH